MSKQIIRFYGVVPGIGARLKMWRKSKKLKGREVIKMIEVSQGSFSDLEHEKSFPSCKTLSNLHIYTDLNIIWLLTGDGEMLQEKT